MRLIMKKFKGNFLLGLLLSLLGVILIGCSSNSIDGTWVPIREGVDDFELIIDGENAQLKIFDNSGRHGVVNPSENKIIFDEDFEDENFTYELVDNQLVLTSGEIGIALKKADKNKKIENDSSSSKNSEDSKHYYENEYYLDIDSGEYEVSDDDVKPGTYKVIFLYENSEFEDITGDGKMTITSNDGESRTYDFHYDREQFSSNEEMITLEKGEIIRIESDGERSFFNLERDN